MHYVWSCAPSSYRSAANVSWLEVRVCPPLLFVGVVPALLCLFTCVGNLFVLAAVAASRKLRRKHTTILLCNLATADLFVGAGVMPIGVFNLVVGQTWVFGRALCRIWVSLDVVCCTASIVTLVVISIDRCVGVNKPLHYQYLITRHRTLVAVAFVWVYSLSVLLATVNYASDRSEPLECHVGDELRFVTQSVVLSFFIPLTIILTVYYRIYKVTRRRAESLLHAVPQQTQATRKRSRIEEALARTEQVLRRTSLSVLSPLRVHYGGVNVDPAQHSRYFAKHKKSATTLALVVGAFLVCWLPFFTCYLFNHLVGSEVVPGFVLEIFTWLGYSNSSLNPLIYTFTMRTFNDTLHAMLRRVIGSPLRRSTRRLRRSWRQRLMQESRTSAIEMESTSSSRTAARAVRAVGRSRSTSPDSGFSVESGRRARLPRRPPPSAAAAAAAAVDAADEATPKVRLYRKKPQAVPSSTSWMNLKLYGLLVSTKTTTL